MNEKRQPLWRRLLLPLGLSLGLHVLLFAWTAFVPSRPAAEVIASASSPLTVTVQWNERRAKSPPNHDPRLELPDHLEPVVGPLGKEVEVALAPMLPQGRGGGEDTQRAGSPGASGSGRGAAGKPGLLAPPSQARRIAYVIDRSVSMGASGALNRARAEVVASLRALPPQAQFVVVVYHRFATPLLSLGWLCPDEATLAAVEQRLNELPATGSTDHVRALRQALLTRPDVLFWVTDADDLSEAAVAEVTRLNDGHTSIHVVELAAGRGDRGSLLTRLAAANRGEHRRVAP